MVNKSVAFSAFLLILFVLAISGHCDGQCKSWEQAAHGACHVRGGKHMCFCYFNCTKAQKLAQDKARAQELAQEKLNAQKLTPDAKKVVPNACLASLDHHNIPPAYLYHLTTKHALKGNNALSELPPKQSWTSIFGNDYEYQVKEEQGVDMMTGIETSYVPSSSDQRYPLAGSEKNYGNTGQACEAMSQTQDYTAYLNNMSGFNYGNPLSNEGSSESLAFYQKKVEELTNSHHQTEGMLAMAQAVNGSMQNAVNGLHSENESLKSHYSMSYASYSSIFGDLNRAKGLEANLSRKVSALEREKSALRRDLDWVMKKAIPRMLAMVFRSEQFDRELVKVPKVFVEHGHELGRQEARELMMANQRLPDCDPKKTRGECMESLTSFFDLSPSLPRSVLERGDSGAGEGSSSRSATQVYEKVLYWSVGAGVV
nr:defensin-like protein 19 [Tanacetum cinerariifolium]